MKTAFEFLKHFTEDLRIYPDGTSDKDILQMRNAILKAMENFAKQEVNEALASKATAILPHVSQQRELLIDLLTKLENGGGSSFIDKEQIVNDYLKTN